MLLTIYDRHSKIKTQSKYLNSYNIKYYIFIILYPRLSYLQIITNLSLLQFPQNVRVIQSL